ncbi:MAG: SLBB domain-containing protein, partial [Gemmatimonadota bacterium]
ALASPRFMVAQQPPTRPPGVTDQQIQQAIQQRGLGGLVASRIRESGMTPDQIRARLQSAGYSQNILDAYLGAEVDTTQRPTQDVLRALAALGLEPGEPGEPGDTASLAVTPDTLPAPPATSGLQLFGLDVFRRSTTQFTAATSGPVDPDYRLGAGDELVLILTGDVELAHQLNVTREGFVVIPQVGQIFVANLTLEQLRSLLFTRLGRVYSGVRRGEGATTRFEITVSRLRVNQIFVNGEVVRPGAYAVSAIGTVMNALYAAGGPTERGNFRAVRILRRGQLVRTLDLYDYLLGGNTRDDIRLEQGDVVFVPPRGRRVSIEGSVVRPAIYDLAQGQDLRELIEMSGGLLPEAYTGRAQVERILPPDQRQPGGRDRTVIDVDLGTIVGAHPTARFALEPDDRIAVTGVAVLIRDRLVLRGNVWRPGDYQLEPGMRLSRLIRAAGGLKTDTYIGRAHILRLMPDSTRRLIPVDLGPIAGAIDGPGPGAGSPSPAAPGTDPELQEFDEITVYSLTDFRPTRQIAVYGNVNRPGLYDFNDSMTLRDAVIRAGGLRDDAYLLEAEIARIPETRLGGELATIQRVPLDSTYVVDPTGYLRRETPARGAEHRLQPYDNVFIRRVPGFELQRNVVLSGEVRFPGRYTL